MVTTDDEGGFSSEIDSNEIPDWNRKKEQTKSYKEIVASAIEKCRVECSKQMIKGIEIFQNINGQLVPRQLEDQRKIFEQSVMSLKFLLIFTYDDEAKKNITQYEKNIETAYEKYFNKYIEAEQYHPHKEWSKQSGQFNQKSLIASHYLQHMEEYVLEQWYKIYQELLLLYKRKNELSRKRTIPLY